jgi:2-polyprenyl-3-methyl-5-hydroxy-6-metoxy-1,4-benzoquinol methylase
VNSGTRGLVAAQRFDYSGIPIGFYDSVLRGGNPIRRLWHLSKFERVLDCLPHRPGQSLLDVGCFAGSFLSLVPRERFERQVGVDILREQVDYARARYGTPFRTFQHVDGVAELDSVQGTFDCVTLIEVIEHLTAGEAGVLLAAVARKLRPGGRLVLTTPNYASAWPLVELALNRLSEVKYEEQHITRFDSFRIARQLARLHPAFDRDFRVELKTTTHFLTPFLAGLSFGLAHRLSRLVPHRHWPHPFGNLILLVAVRREEAAARRADEAGAGR